MKTVAVFGATSLVAQHVVRLFAAQGWALCLAARNAERLSEVARDARARGASSVTEHVADLADIATLGTLADAVWTTAGGLDAVLVAQGILPDQLACQGNVDAVMETFRVNCLGVMALLTPLANRMEQQGRGVLCVVSSVAGERGRRSNYVYGASKSALATFMEGLHHRLSPRGVAVVTIKPGFIRSPMTAGVADNPLFADADAVARTVFRAMHGKRSTVYAPWFWRPIMAGIRALPARVFRHLPL